MRVGSFVAVALVALSLPGAALAQGTPPANPPAGAPPGTAPQIFRVPTMLRGRMTDSAFALGMAYREIGRAENAGATGGHYIDAARTHYRSAIARHGRNDDAGASAEARLASDLARVALDERPANAQTGPKDIPAPPTPRPAQPRARDGATLGGGGEWRGMPGGPPGFGEMHVRVMDGAGFAMRRGGGFDATRLAEILKVETSPEARQLAQNAVDANSAAQRAALAGNVDEAARQSRIAGDLAAAVHDLAVLNHPELGRSRMPMRIMEDFMPIPLPQ